MTNDTVWSIQLELGEMAQTVRGMETRIREMLGLIPESIQRDAMEEGVIPADVATDLVGVIECLLGDDLPEVIRKLEEGARLTDDELRRRFEDEQRRRGGQRLPEG